MKGLKVVVDDHCYCVALLQGNCSFLLSYKDGGFSEVSIGGASLGVYEWYHSRELVPGEHFSVEFTDIEQVSPYDVVWTEDEMLENSIRNYETLKSELLAEGLITQADLENED